MQESMPNFSTQFDIQRDGCSVIVPLLPSTSPSAVSLDHVPGFQEDPAPASKRAATEGLEAAEPEDKSAAGRQGDAWWMRSGGGLGVGVGCLRIDEGEAEGPHSHSQSNGTTPSQDTVRACHAVHEELPPAPSQVVE